MKPLIGFVCLLFLFSCSKKEAPDQPAVLTMESAKSIGDRVAGQVGSTLKGALSKAMKAGGPVAAISICSMKAYALTDSIARLDPNVVRLKRTSLRIRNPKNAADSSEIAAIAVFEEIIKSGGVPGERIVREESDGKPFRYFKAILVEPVCLACHGTDEYLNKEVLEEIEKIYPDDRATGFHEGELRGVFSIIIRSGDGDQDGTISASTSVR